MCFDVVIVNSSIPLYILPTKIKAKPERITLFPNNFIPEQYFSQAEKNYIWDGWQIL